MDFHAALQANVLINCFRPRLTSSVMQVVFSTRKNLLPNGLQGYFTLRIDQRNHNFKEFHHRTVFLIRPMTGNNVS